MDMGKCLSSKLGYCVNLSSGMFTNDLSLVIQLPSGSLYISGVALLGHWNIYDIQVPKDPNDLFLGDPEISSKGLQKANPTNRYYYYYCPEPRAFIMHERCWTLMTRILDVCLIEKHLDLFLTILTEKVDHGESEVECLVPEIDYWNRPKKQYEDLSWDDPKEYLKIYEPKARPRDGYYKPRDPCNIPELRDLLNNPGKIQRQAQRKKKPTTPRKLLERKPRTHTMPLRSLFYLDRRSIRIPIDIILIIMDFLPEFRDIRFLLWVFPQWKPLIPQGYWRLRCINELVIEQPLPAADELDWRYLYFHIDKLLSKSHGWLNRQRIMKNLARIKAKFLKSVLKERPQIK